MLVYFISGAEIFVIFLIVLLLFGADKIPDIAKGLGKGIRQVKDATQEIKTEIQKKKNQEKPKTSQNIEALEKIKHLDKSEYVLRPDFINTLRLFN